MLYPDFDARLKTLIEPSPSQYRILHLAAHSASSLSGIALSLVNRESQPFFGFLKRDDVENLDLRCDLVVISSCDSCSGPNLSGEGITNINHAFLSAANARVLSTLYSVETTP